MRDRWHDMARQTVRHLAVSTDFVPLKWHYLARHIAGTAGTRFVPARGSLYYGPLITRPQDHKTASVSRQTVGGLSGNETKSDT